MVFAIQILAAAGTLGTRLMGFGMMSLVAAILIFAGIQNIKTKTAIETGSRQLVNKAMGKSNTYVGSKAVLVGWINIICGIGLAIAGIVFLFVGPVLADQ